jgi:hypothetical protein
MERFHAIRKHKASWRFRKRGHDCLNPHDSHCSATPTTSTLRYVGRSTGASRAAASHESRVATRPQVKPNSRFEYQDAKFQKNSAGKEMLAPPRVRYLSQGGPGGHCRYPEDRVPRVQAPGQDRRPAPGPPRVLRTQLPLPGPGQLRGRHVSCGPSSRCPAQGSLGAATCLTDPAPAARPEAAPRPPRVLLWEVCAPSETPNDKQTPCAYKTCGQGRLQGCSSVAPTRCPYTADCYSVGQPDSSVSCGVCIPRRPAARS